MIDEKKFRVICDKEYKDGPGRLYSVKFINDSNQELAIRASMFNNRQIAALLKECERQQLECYFCGVRHLRIRSKSAAMFVAFKG